MHFLTGDLSRAQCFTYFFRSLMFCVRCSACGLHACLNSKYVDDMSSFLTVHKCCMSSQNVLDLLWTILFSTAIWRMWSHRPNSGEAMENYCGMLLRSLWLFILWVHCWSTVFLCGTKLQGVNVHISVSYSGSLWLIVMTPSHPFDYMRFSIVSMHTSFLLVCVGRKEQCLKFRSNIQLNELLLLEAC